MLIGVVLLHSFTCTSATSLWQVVVTGPWSKVCMHVRNISCEAVKLLTLQCFCCCFCCFLLHVPFFVSIQAAEVCAVYRLNITTEWYRWHGAAILRLGKTFPLEALARIREAYRTQEVPAEQQLQQLLSTVPWRLQRLQEQQQREERRDAKKAMIGFKMDQRRRQNIADAEKKAAASSGVGSVGMGLQGPGGRDNWRKRKLKPPGTLGRKF